MGTKNKKLHGLFPNLLFLLLAGAVLFFSACAVGPKYQRPSAPVPAAYKEAPPATSQEAGNWKPSQPSDGAAKGKWWEIYNDPALNALEEQVSVSNQNVLAAEAQYREARDAVRIARSGLFPTVTADPSIVESQSSRTATSGTTANLSTAPRTAYNLPIDFTYVADLWGSIHRSVTASAAAAQLSAAQLENARLSLQAELAVDYFQLHGSDGDHDLLDRTVKSYQEYLTLTQNRYNGGIASGGDVAQAETQLHTARAQLIDLGESRAQFEHAIAILTGKPPADLSIPLVPLNATPPPIPAGVPSALLERRPDIAGAERQMAAANEQIGIAQAAYYPTLTLSASGGLESGRFLRWFSWPSRFWSVGPQLAETLFDAGRRRAQTDQARAAFDATVANYRQTVLTGFQQVEDNLAALRVLSDEAQAEDDAVKAAQRSLQISSDQYKAGTVSYLQVITTQAIALQDERTAVDIQTRRMVASVLLVQALGGGWDASKLPSKQDLVSGK
ncbi:MAG TPA: efflux transporter outer membrane subunit [Terriglobia bacterium]|nr:efflux transporter outer membrane subunit [Terriglobia bacterium]